MRALTIVDRSTVFWGFACKTELREMLYLIGLGLCDERDITLRGLDAVKECDYVYLEAYTSTLGVDPEKLSALYSKPILVADREFVEQNAEEMIERSKDRNVAFLVVGDPFGATTHTDLWIRAKRAGVPVKVIHNASIMNAIGCTGLQLYRFGETVSIVFFTDTWRPDSFYDKIESNRKLGLHTLCLLDIKVKEQSEENLCRGRKIYEPPRYMSVSLAAHQLIEVSERRAAQAQERDPGTTWKPSYDAESIGVGVARIGHDDQLVISGTLRELASTDFGTPLHSLVLAGDLHEMELEYISFFKKGSSTSSSSAC